jgi:hypothetical protein
MADGKSVYVGKENRRTFTTIADYNSDEASRNRVRCKGALPSEKCLPFELRTEKADTDSMPAPVLLSRKTTSLRSIMMDAVEGPLPQNQVPMESHISGFGQNTEFSIQPPKPALKPYDSKKALEVQPVEIKKPEVVATPTGAPPTHPASQTVQVPKQHPYHQHQAASPTQATPAPGAPPPNADFYHHTSNPCSSISEKQCPCTQDNDLPLLWRPSQYVVDRVEEVSLAVPEQKDRDLKKDPLHILVIGVGTGSISMSVLNNCRVFVPGGLKVESVEPDQSTLSVAQQLFGFKALPGVHKIEVNKCGDAIQQRQKDGNAANGGKYDVVVINVFNGDDTVPSQCKNQTFLGQIKSLVKDQGVVMNIVHDKQLSETITDYTAVFGYRVRKDQVKERDGPTNYHVIMAGDLDLAKSGAAWSSFTGFVTTMLILFMVL